MRRRTALLGGTAAALSIGAMSSHGTETPAGENLGLSSEDVLFLQDLRRRCYRYFLAASDPKTGLVADRARADGSDICQVASSAACGFALSAFSVAPAAGLSSSQEATKLTGRLMRSLLGIVDQEQGFVYHFFDRTTGQRRYRCDASSIDTAIMLAGVMSAQATFEDAEIQHLSNELLDRTNWRWMLGDNGLLHMGWTPESGFLPYQWDSFSELVLLVLMAIGAPRNAVPADCWHAWRREPVLHFQGRPYLSYPPIFVHQYPLAFFDLRDRVSSNGIDYWQNARTAHDAHIDFVTALSNKYPERFGHYGGEMWGITSSDSVDGYRDWGGPYLDGRVEPDRGIDGTVVPSAAGGALPIVPQRAVATLRHQHYRFGQDIYGPFGFANAFNPATGWVSSDVIGIDTGITLLMAENLLSGSVWKAFMSHPVAQRGLARAGFSSPESA